MQSDVADIDPLTIYLEDSIEEPLRGGPCESSPHAQQALIDSTAFMPQKSVQVPTTSLRNPNGRGNLL